MLNHCLKICLLVGIVMSLTKVTPEHPSIPTQFTTNVSMMITGLSIGEGPFLYDSDDSKLRMECLSMEAVTRMPLNHTFFYNKEGSWISKNGFCKPTALGEFVDFFSWLKYATFAGNDTVGGRNCQRWKLSDKTYNLSMCVQGNRPIEYLIEQPTYPPTINYTWFGDFQVGTPDQNLLNPPEDCFVLPSPCPNGQREMIDAYVFHPKNTTGDIVDQDVADLLGDTIFICADAVSNHTAFDQYEYVSLYQLEVMSSWGEYQECNGYPSECIGETDGNVGREASMGVGNETGRCSNNTAVGNWYSLPKKGLCAANHAPGDYSGCKWRIEKRVKTIDSKCLLHDQKMLSACIEEKTLPLTKSKSILYNAMHFNDNSQGGCPNIVP